MKPAFAIVLSLVVLLVGASYARADEKADALLKEVVAAEKAAQTLTADFIWSQQDAGKSANVSWGTVKLKKPNLVHKNSLHISDTGETGDALISDGKTFWTFEKATNQYLQMPADSPVFNLMMQWYVPLGAFLNPDRLTRPEIKARSQGKETIEGVAYQIVEITEEGLLPQTTRLYIGPDKLVHRAAVHLKQGGPKGIRFEVSLHEVKTGQALTAADFAFQPPKDAKSVDLLSSQAADSTANYDAKLVPVGKDAPNFTLPTPTGGQVALGEVLKGKKALLVNFWFYH